MTEPKINLKNVRSFYGLLDHTNKTEIRVFGEKYPAGKSVLVSNEEEFVKQVCQFNETEKVDVYVGLNDRTGKGDANIVSSQYLFIDIDPIGINLEETCKEVEKIFAENKLEYCFKAWSGGGYHYYIKYPKITTNLKQFYNKIKNAMKQMPKGVDTNVYNPERVVRVIGTYSHKRKSKTKIIEINSKINTPETINTFIDNHYFSELDILKKSYEDIMRNGVEKGSRNDSLFRIACHLRKNNFDSSDALLFLQGINNKNNPPLSEQELHQIVKSAYSYQENNSFSHIEEGLSITAQELLELKIPELKWLIPGVVAEQQYAMVAGLPESFKTFFLLYAIINASLGLPVLNNEAQDKVKVLFIDQESREQRLQKRIKQIVKGQGISERLDNIHFEIFRGHILDTDEGLRRISQLIEETKCDLVVIDSLVRISTGGEDKADDMKIIGSNILKLSQRHKTAFILIAHMRKMAGQYPSLQDIRGSGDLGGAIDSAIGFTKLSKTKFKINTMKTRDSVTPDTITFEVQDLDNGGISIRYAGKYKKPPSKVESCQNAILEWASEQEEDFRTGDCKTEITKEFTKSTFETAFRILKENKEIIHQGHGLYKGKDKLEVSDLNLDL
jgi:RecA-family ATPase